MDQMGHDNIRVQCGEQTPEKTLQSTDTVLNALFKRMSVHANLTEASLGRRKHSSVLQFQPKLAPFSRFGHRHVLLAYILFL